jgi:hypothetical protein
MTPWTRFPRLLAALLLACAVRAEDPGPFKTSGNGEIWGYGTAQDRVDDSPLNPGNLVANLPAMQWTGEARLNLRVTTESAELVVRPRVLEQHNPGTPGAPDLDQAYLSQAFARIRLGDALTFTGGRELLTWGPGNFRSPSNPLYFDAGRTDPLRDVPGVDLARLTWTQGPLSLMLARELDVGHNNPAVTPKPTTLAKADLRGQDTQLSAIVGNQVWGAPFYGGFAQATLGQAWLVYGEWGSGQRTQALAANPVPFAAPFAVQVPSPRQSTELLGASYTLLNGQSVGLEWLRDGHGFSGQGERQYFADAALVAGQVLAAPGSAAAPLELAALGQGLAQAPALLGRDYGSLLWQSNPQETGKYWRLMWTADLRDRSSQVTGYGEKNLSARFSAFAALTHNLGGAETEFGCLFRTALTLGFKYFAF